MKSSRIVTWLGAGALASALAFGAVAADRAAAQTAVPGSAAAQLEHSAQHPRHRPGAPGVKLRAARGIVTTTADVLGMQREEVVSELRAGKSLAQIATEHGKTGDDVVNALVDKARERLDQAVANGRIPQDKADQLLGKLRERLATLVERTDLLSGRYAPGADRTVQ